MAYQKHNFKDGDILKAEHLNCIEDCIAEAPNWNAAEGEPGHVLNRTHWEESSLVEVLPEWTFKSSSGNGQTLKTPLGLTPGKTYIVNWEGAEYKCVAFTVVLAVEAGTTFSATIIGDFSKHSPLAPATGDPFGIFEYDQQELVDLYGAVQIRPNDDTTREYTISITEVNETVHKLDGKYLPNGVPYLEGGGEPVELLPPTKLEELNGAFIVPADAGIVLVDGGNYVVNWNGTEYTCTAQYFAMDGESAIVMGNIGLVFGDGEDTGEPFVILYSEMLAAMGASLYVISLAGDTEVTLGLVGSPPLKIHKIDTRCLPDCVPYMEEVTDEIPVVGEWESAGSQFTFANQILELGKKYIVTWERTGAVYEDVAKRDREYISLGDSSGTQNEYPFWIYQTRNRAYLALTNDGKARDPFSIKVVHEVPHKIDTDLLPDSVPIAKETVLLEEAEAVSFTHPAFGTMWGIYQGVPDLKAGKTYTVTYNGTPYKCLCQAAPAGLIEDPNAVAMGNFSVVGGPNTGEPFAMLISHAYQEVDIIDLVGSASVKVKIVGEVVRKLDPKLLPESVATKEYVNEMLGVIENGTY